MQKKYKKHIKAGHEEVCTAHKLYLFALGIKQFIY